jgi:hypothetical protein
MSLAQRQAFSTIKRAYAAKGRKPVTTPSTLRLIQNVVANRTTYSFPILEGDSGNNLAENRFLNRADAFTATSVGIFIGGLSDAGAAVTTGAYQLQGYQSEPVTAAGVTNANALFMQGYMNVLVNNVAYLQNFDLFRTYSAPAMQTNYTFATGGDGTLKDSINGERDGFCDLVPTLQFSGTAKIDITINLPTSLVFTNACQINLIFRGFLSLGASNLNK